MSDFKSTIHIEDGFSDSLKNLTKSAWDCQNAVFALTTQIFRLESEKVKSSLDFALTYAKKQAAKQASALFAIKKKEFNDVMSATKASLVARAKVAKRFFEEQMKEAKASLLAMREKYAMQLAELKKYLIARAKEYAKNKVKERISEATQPIKDKAKQNAINGIKKTISDPKKLTNLIGSSREVGVDLNKTFKKNLDELKKNAKERAKVIKNNIETQLKQRQSEFKDYKTKLTNKLEELKKNTRERTKIYKNNIEFEIKERQVEFYDYKNKLAHKLDKFKENTKERAKIYKNNIEFEIKERQVEFYDYKNKLEHKLDKFKKNIKDRTEVYKNSIENEIKSRQKGVLDFKEKAKEKAKVLRNNAENEIKLTKTNLKFEIDKGMVGLSVYKNRLSDKLNGLKLNIRERANVLKGGIDSGKKLQNIDFKEFKANLSGRLSAVRKNATERKVLAELEFSLFRRKTSEKISNSELEMRARGKYGKLMLSEAKLNANLELKTIKGNVESEIKVRRIEFRGFKENLSERISVLKKNANEKKSIANKEFLSFKQKVSERMLSSEIELRGYKRFATQRLSEAKLDAELELRAYKKMGSQKLSELKNTSMKRLSIIKNNLAFELKEQQVGWYDYKNHLSHRLDALKKNINQRKKAIQQGLLGKKYRLEGKFYLAKRDLEMRGISKDAMKAFGENSVKNVKALGKSAKKVGRRFVSNAKEMGIKGAANFEKQKLKELILNKSEHYLSSKGVNVEQLKKQIAARKNAPKQSMLSKFMKTDLGKLGAEFAKNTAKMFGLGILSEITLRAGKAMFNQAKKAGEALVESIQKSLDEISLSDKLNAAYGEAGESAKNIAYNLANELGENATMVGQMAAKAADMGIGTDDFERIMRLSDKVSKLTVGATTEETANNLINSVKSGHDAGTIASMLGGGEMMERQIKRAGYERALNRGDIEGALKIAEQVTEQAGFTDEKYKTASDSLSENFKFIMNNVDNIKHKFAELFNQMLAPTVKKISDLIKSKGFQLAIGVAERAFKAFGSVVNWFVESVVDNLHVIGILMGVGIITKLYLMVTNLKFMAQSWLFIAKWSRKIIKFLKLDLLFEKLIHKEKIKQFLAQKAMAALKVVGIWTAVAAAIAAATYGIYKLTGTTKSFTGWLKGILAAGYVFLRNVAMNIFIFFDNLKTKFESIGKRIKAFIYATVGVIKSAGGKVFVWLAEMLENFLKNTSFGKALAKGLKKLGVDTNGFVDSAKEWANGAGQKELTEARKLYEEIEKMDQYLLDYIDVTSGMIEAYEDEGKAVFGEIKSSFGKLLEHFKNQEDTQHKIASDTNKIRKHNEQEEELKWLKMFSDRQTTSGYNYNTSNTMNLTQNGVSQENMRRSAILNPRARAGRAAS